MKITKGTIIRSSVLFLALINQILLALGYKVIDIDDDTVTQLVSVAFTIITALVAWWKNNSFTKEAILSDQNRKEGR